MDIFILLSKFGHSEYSTFLSSVRIVIDDLLPLKEKPVATAIWDLLRLVHHIDHSLS